MDACNQFLIITFLSIIILFLMFYSERRWDKPTHAKYDIYIFILQIFFIPLNIYNLYIIFGPLHRKKPRAVLADVGSEPGHAVCISEFQSPLNFRFDVRSIEDLVSLACNHMNYEDSWHRPFLGTREVISREVKTRPDGTAFEKLDLGSYKWLTYKQVDKAIMHVASGLGNLDIRKDQRVAIFSDNRAEFFIAMHGCFRRGVVVVILDTSLGEDALLQSLNETEVVTVICGCKELKKLTKIHGQLESVKCLICMDDDIPFSDSSTLHGWTIISMADVRKLGRICIRGQHIPLAEELALIMYTSGSTGLPKGVMMTHANIIATTIAIMSILPKLGINDVHLAYLPMAHIHELVVEHIIAGAGGAIGYGSPLTDRIKKGTKDDVTTLVPTMIAAVPAILDHVCDGVLKEVNANGGISKKLFDFAYQRRLQAVNGSWFGAWGLEKVLWNLLVFRKVRTIVGGHRMRFIISSGAPLSPNTQRFINICLSSTILQGYGLIETCGSGTFSDFDDTNIGRVGLPLPFSYVKALIDWPEGGYSTNDSMMPSGEIVIGGSSVTLGYFKNEERTRESYKVDEKGVRWFYTGDIGRFHADGCLEIIDRKDDILKLKHGDYVSLGKVEAAFLASPFVDNILLHIDSFYSYSVALVAVSLPTLEDWASKQGIAYSDLAQLCCKEEAVNEVYASLVKEGKKACLEKIEIPARIKLLASPWTLESGLVSATLKMKRESIRKAFQEELLELYAL